MMKRTRRTPIPQHEHTPKQSYQILYIKAQDPTISTKPLPQQTSGCGHEPPSPLTQILKQKKLALGDLEKWTSNLEWSILT